MLHAPIYSTSIYATLCITLWAQELPEQRAPKDIWAHILGYVPAHHTFFNELTRRFSFNAAHYDRLIEAFSARQPFYIDARDCNQLVHNHFNLTKGSLTLKTLHEHIHAALGRSIAQHPYAHLKPFILAVDKSRLIAEIKSILAPDLALAPLLDTTLCTQLDGFALSHLCDTVARIDNHLLMLERCAQLLTHVSQDKEAHLNRLLRLRPLLMMLMFQYFVSVPACIALLLEQHGPYSRPIIQEFIARISGYTLTPTAALTLMGIQCLFLAVQINYCVYKPDRLIIERRTITALHKRLHNFFVQLTILRQTLVRSIHKKQYEPTL